MSSKTQEEARLTRYLLGELSEAERERLEEEYFADDDAFEQMFTAEDELIDAYARGELSAEEHQRFEKLFLASPRGRERVQFARSLAGAVADARPAVATQGQAPRPSRLPFFGALRARGMALRFALAAAALAVAVGLTWLLFERARMREELRQLRAERATLDERARESERRAAGEQARSAEMLAQLEAARARPTPEAGRLGAETGAPPRPPQASRPPRGQVKKNDAVIARRSPGKARKSPLLNTADATIGGSYESRRKSQLPLNVRNKQTVLGLLAGVPFDLRPGLVRGGGGNVLAVPGNATSIFLRLNLEKDTPHETYRAVIETAEGRSVWRADSVVGAGVTVDLPAVPARDLPPGDYVLLLSGRRPDGSLEGVADYSFRIVGE